MSAGLTPWIVFFAAVSVMLALDLAVGRRRETTTRVALIWSGAWIALGLAFAGAVWAWRDGVAAQEYLAGYLIEKSLSIDNLFVFLVVFGSLGIALRHQRRVLFWGIIGAIVMRGAMIAAGVVALERFHWIIYLFGALLLATAVRLMRTHGQPADPARNPLVRLTRRLVPVATDYDGPSFTVHRQGTRLLTPLAVALVAIESTDVVFAVDSVPAVLAVTDDPFVAFTSNVAAILGMRSLYLALAGTLRRFAYLSWGFAAVLVFVGAKMLLSDVVHLPAWTSLAVIVAAVGGAALASVWFAPDERRERRGPDRHGPAADERRGHGHSGEREDMTEAS